MKSAYSIAELAELAGVTRRTVRYYVEENLLPPPLGVGRGRHYGADHLKRLLEVKAMQEKALTLEEIRDALSIRASGRAPVASGQIEAERSRWTRIILLPGVELHVSAEYKVPTPIRLSELAQWCRQFLRRYEED